MNRLFAKLIERETRVRQNVTDVREGSNKFYHCPMYPKSVGNWVKILCIFLISCLLRRFMWLVMLPCGRSGGHWKCITNEAWGPVISIIIVTGELHTLPPRLCSLSAFCRYVFPTAETIVKKCSYFVRKIVGWGGRTGLYPLAVFSHARTHTHTHRGNTA